MVDSRTLERLRVELADSRRVKGFNKYPAKLREQAVAYALARRSSGAGPAQIARELGVAVTTADAWSQSATVASGKQPGRVGSRAGDELSLAEMVVRAQTSGPQAAAQSWMGHRALRLEVDFADGTKLQATGIGAQDVARAIELLRRPA